MGSCRCSSRSASPRPVASCAPPRTHMESTARDRATHIPTHGHAISDAPHSLTTPRRHTSPCGSRHATHATHTAAARHRPRPHTTSREQHDTRHGAHSLGTRHLSHAPQGASTDGSTPRGLRGLARSHAYHKYVMYMRMLSPLKCSRSLKSIAWMLASLPPSPCAHIMSKADFQAKRPSACRRK